VTAEQHQGFEPSPDWLLCSDERAGRQLNAEALKSMTQAEIAKATKEGRFDRLLGRKP
jgi:hypothetical protein